MPRKKSAYILKKKINRDKIALLHLACIKTESKISQKT